MNICQYEFQFQNEFMEKLEIQIGKILNIPINSENMIRLNVDDYSFFLRKRNVNNFMLFSAYKSSYVYLVIIRCEKKYERELKRVLLEICDEIEDAYGEDHKREVQDVYNKADNEFRYLDSKYNMSELIEYNKL